MKRCIVARFVSRASVAAVAAVAAAPAVRAQSLNVDLGSNLSVTAPPAAYGGGANQAGFWNAVSSNAAGVPLAGLDGLPTAATVAVTGGFPVGSMDDHPATSGADGLLIDDYEISFQSLPLEYRFAGLEHGTYAVYTYAWDPLNPVGGGSEHVVSVALASEPAQTVGGPWSGSPALGDQFARHTVHVSNGDAVDVLIEGVSVLPSVLANGFQLVKLSAGVGFCFGNAADCPCANGGSSDAGCDIAQGTGGIALSVQAFAPDGVGGGSADFLASGYPIASQPGVTLIRSPAAESSPVVFGDGLRCITVPLVRVNATLASGGTSLNPVMHGAGSGTFYYQVWVRNTPIMFCDPGAAFNFSNGVGVHWP